MNTIPGMTETSLLPMAAAAAGIEYDALTERILASAVARAAAGNKGKGKGRGLTNAPASHKRAAGRRAG